MRVLFVLAALTLLGCSEDHSGFISLTANTLKAPAEISNHRAPQPSESICGVIRAAPSE
jgi:hypothetical protein